MPLSDLQIVTNSFVEMGGPVFGKRVLNWNIRSRGIQVRTNVKAPQVMTKLSAKGAPRPYRSQGDTTGNGAKFTDRTLTALQSKWDYEFDPEDFRNTYLAKADGAPFAEAANDQVAKEYLDHLLRTTLYFGVKNAAGTGPADICDGFGKVIADEITAINLVPVITGAITNTNAVDKVEMVAEAVPSFMRQEGAEPFFIHCSFNVFDKYKKHYRVLNSFAFKPDETGRYKIDGVNAYLMPQVFMGNSQRLIATLDGNLVVGTDIEQVQVHATARMNISEVRQMMPLGVQIQDLDCLVVNDQP
jgi:hypothetical protein